MVWGKPAAEGAAAVLTTAENENEQQKQQEKSSEDFPSLMEAAVAMKGGKKSKRNQTKMSLSEFTTGIASGPGAKSLARVSAESRGLTPEEMMALPTGPRQRTEEELQQERERGGFKSGGFFPRDYSNSGSGPRRRDSEDLYPPREPSRADAAERWGGAGGGGGGGVTRASEREPPRFGFGDGSYSKADDVDNWSAAKKSAAPPAAAREKKFGFGFSDSASYSRADGTENWSSGKRENGFGRREGGFSSSSAFDSIRKDRDYGGERWGNGGGDGSGTERKRLVLQPRSVGVDETGPMPLTTSATSSRNNPFGNARPREEVLKDKGQDWRTIDMEIHSRSGREAARGAADWQQQQQYSWPEGDWRKKENSREAKGTSDLESESESGSVNGKTAVVAATCEEVDKLADNLNVKTELGGAEGSQI